MLEQIWIRQLTCRRCFDKVLVAIASKHARQLWAMLAREQTYDADAWLKALDGAASGRQTRHHSRSDGVSPFHVSAKR